MPKKRSQRCAELEVRIAQALDAIQKKEVATTYTASKVYDVSYMTLSRRVKGGFNNAQGHEQSQLLLQAEKDTLQL
jgi:hypothetical protein